VAAQMIGRMLTREECVHHINGDVSDDRPENLLVMSYDKHRHLHNGTTPSVCGMCGDASAPHCGGYCSACHARKQQGWTDERIANTPIRRRHHRTGAEKLVPCRICKGTNKCHANGLCKTCYNREWKRAKRGQGVPA